MRTDGVALVLVTGILALMVLLVSVQASRARLAAEVAAGSGAARKAALASTSALDYAAARLLREPLATRTPEVVVG